MTKVQNIKLKSVKSSVSCILLTLIIAQDLQPSINVRMYLLLPQAVTRYCMVLVIELIKFWWHWPHFRSQNGTFNCPKYVFHTLSSEPVDGFWPNFNRYIVWKRGRVIRFWWPWPNFQGHRGTLKCQIQIHCWEEGKSWSSFGDLELYFKVTMPLWNIQNVVSVRYLRN